jgi:nitrate reductase alpha subunit
MDPKIILWTLSIGTLYLTMNSRMAYLVSGIFIGINYREHLTPYTEPVQEIVTKGIVEIKTAHFPDIVLPFPTPKPKPKIPKSYVEQLKDMFFSNNDENEKRK